MSIDKYGNVYSNGSVKNALNQTGNSTLTERDSGQNGTIITIAIVLVVLTVFAIGAYFLFKYYTKRMLEIEKEKELLNQGI